VTILPRLFRVRHKRHRFDRHLQNNKINTTKNMHTDTQHVMEIRQTKTTTRSCRDPETAVTNLWSPGVRGRPQRVPSAGSGGRRLLLLLVLLYFQMGDKNLIIRPLLINQDLSVKSVRVHLWRMLSRMCTQSLATIAYEIKKP